MHQSVDLKFKKLLKYFLWLGTTCFGGPVALTAAMQRDLVEENPIAGEKDFTHDQFKTGLLLSQICPGPQATQLAMYLGWVLKGWRGAAMAGLALVIPSFLIVIVLAEVYLRFGNTPQVKLFFDGTVPIVSAVVVLSLYRMMRKFLMKEGTLWGVGIVSFVVHYKGYFSFWEILLFFGIAGMFYPFLKQRLFGRKMFWTILIFSIFVPATYLLAEEMQKTGEVIVQNVPGAWDLFSYFTEVGTFVVGSGLTILPYLHEGVVKKYQWLSERQFVDSIAVAMLSPGPLVITVAFIGYLILGMKGAVLAALGIFLPPYLFTLMLAPVMKLIANNPLLNESMDFTIAAAIGCVASSLLGLFAGVLSQIPTFLIFVVSMVLVLTIMKGKEFILILAGGVISVIFASR